MLSKVASTNRLSCVLAPLVVMPNGMPLPSVNKLRLVPPLARSVGFGPVFFPPERSFGHCSVHTLPTPVDAFQVIVLQERHRPKSLKNTALDEHLKIAMQRATRSKLRRHGFPLTAGSHDIEDTVENGSPFKSGPASLFALAKLGQKKFHSLYQRIRQAKFGINLKTFHPWTPAKGHPCLRQILQLP